MKTLVIIPSRMSATRLPGKPLLKINGLSIISHVSKKAEEANIGDVIIATEDQEIVDDVKRNGFNAILTSNKHKTGTDRIYEAFSKLQQRDIKYVINLQGDEPMINIEDIKNLKRQTLKNKSEISTLACEINDQKKLNDESIVKVRTIDKISSENISRAINFSRKKSYNSKENIYHHIGIYIYKTTTLKKFTELPQTDKEKNKNLNN